MTGRKRTAELSERDREILKDVVSAFILTGEPVSSRTVARRRDNTLSAATIRNTMADLEELGYLSQPHTSAGRVPTEAAYHAYVGSLMAAEPLPAKARKYIDANLGDSEHGDGADLPAMAGHLLSELSEQIGIVMTPAMGETVIRSVDFVPLSGSRVLCVVVSASGFADNKVIETDEALTRKDLTRISNYLTRNFAGMTLRQIRKRLLALMAEERAQVDRLLANAISLAQQALEQGTEQDVLIEGTTAVLGRPELADVERVRRLLETFTNRARLVQVLNQLIHGQGVRVVIGGESDLTADLDFSLVATTYRLGETPVGSLGIFGPSRMQYERVVPLVNYLGDRLTQALNASFQAGGG